jgi:N-acetylglucosaminyldiphosphoundecaprenol N-acetyl-beta-D-mannosaminyltransferase
MTKINLGDFKVDAISQDEVIDLIKKELLKSTTPHIIVTPNAGHLKNIASSLELKEIYSTADLSLIDGWPIAVAAKNASKQKVQRVTGSDLLPKLFPELSKEIRIGIIGGEDESNIRKILEQKYPNLNIQIIDTSPWSTSVYDVRRLRELVQYNALSIVLLCLGHPKQELLAKELKNYDWAGSRPDWIMCVGATIEYLTGTQKRAPVFFQKIGMEWFFRLITNPKKFFSRYFEAIIPATKLILKSFGMRKFN